tara:strand:- start:21270 stop:22280 length:1011 start_codon:yes stop_codon:yes gene_type:complete
LNYNYFGSTGLKVSEIGFGGAAIGYTSGKEEDDACVSCVKEAIDLGINFFDTSPVYGRSEVNLGKGINNQRDKIVLASKVRIPLVEDLINMKITIASSVERSLKRLKTDYIDILQIHHQVGDVRGSYQFRSNPPEFAPRLDYQDCMDFVESASNLIQSGKVRFIGLTGWDGDYNTLKSLIETKKFASIQVLFNILNQSACGKQTIVSSDVDQGSGNVKDDDSILNIAKNNDVAVIGIRSLADGAIVDNLNRKLNEDDKVNLDHKRAKDIRQLLNRDDLSLSQIGILFCLNSKKISSVIPGIKTIQELNEIANIRSLNNLEDEDFGIIDSWYENFLL